MKTKLSILTLALFVSAQAFAANAIISQPKSIALAEKSACTLEGVKGVYKGMIDGGGDWGETVFYPSATGGLSGVYFMHFEQISWGFFSNLNFSEGVLTGTWTDEFGSGTISFSFDDTCSSFTGMWNDSFNWSGTQTTN